MSKVITTAHAHKSGVIFHFFPRPFKQKKIKALRPKMTKIASKGGPALICLLSVSSLYACTRVRACVRACVCVCVCVCARALACMRVRAHLWRSAARTLPVIPVYKVREEFLKGRRSALSQMHCQCKREARMCFCLHDAFCQKIVFPFRKKTPVMVVDHRSPVFSI